MDSINNLRYQLSEKKYKITQFINSHKRLVSALWHLPTEVLSHIFHLLSPERQVPATCIRAGSHAADRNMQTIEGYCYRLPILWCRLLVDVCDDQAAFSCNSCVRLSMISTGNCEKIDVMVKRISKQHEDSYEKRLRWGLSVRRIWI